MTTQAEIRGPGQPFGTAVASHLAQLYSATDAAWLGEQLGGLVSQDPAGSTPASLDQRAVWLIAYADHVRHEGRRPLEVMADLLEEELSAVVSGVHLLPFHPWTSDDGFAVTDHNAVDVSIGTWADVRRVADGRRLVMDAVVNHVSAGHPWVSQWLAGERPPWVVEPDKGFDVSAVVRPRTTPLLTEFHSPKGERRLAWTTFGPDQVDIDYRNPEVLLAMTEILLSYIRGGAGAIRLDAVGFLWKQSGTSCIHLPQTHDIIRLWRTIVDHVAPGTLLITETNVPHQENIAYFGAGDEAHLVYQFPLAPLVLDAYLTGDARVLRAWAHALEDPIPGTAFLNFLGSHDGIGLRPVEGLLPDSRIADLCDLARRAGGDVSHRVRPDGSASPYELNTTYVDALDACRPDGRGVDRIVGAHAILLALQGVPALWFGSLVALPNDEGLVARTGQPRSVNRGRVGRDDLRATLADPHSRPRKVFDALALLSHRRRANPAFDPASPQTLLSTPAWCIAIRRGTPGRRAVVIVSLADSDQRLDRRTLLGEDAQSGSWRAWLTVMATSRERVAETLLIPAYGTVWLEQAA